MKTLSAGMITALASGTPRLCKMLQLQLRDGTRLGFTDHDSDITYNVGDGAMVYTAGSGALISDVALQAGLDADNFEFTAPIRAGGPITLWGVLGGRYNDSKAKLFEVRWSDLASGHIALLAGDTHEVRPQGGKITVEIRNQIARYSQIVGRQIITPCDADYGDARCMHIVETTTMTVSAAPDSLQFTGTYSGSYLDGYFDKGKIVALTGALVGMAPVEIEKWDELSAGTATLKLFHFLADAPAIGDTFQVRRGCAKTRIACMERANMVNYRGFPDVPGTDQVARMPIPGHGGA